MTIWSSAPLKIGQVYDSCEFTVVVTPEPVQAFRFQVLNEIDRQEHIAYWMEQRNCVEEDVTIPKHAMHYYRVSVD